MQAKLITVPSHTAAIRVIQLMNQNQTGVVLVVDQQQLVGIFTERDLIREIATGVCLETANIAALMTHPVITLNLSEAADPIIVLQRLQRYQIRYLPVVDEGKVIEIITPETIQNTLARLQQRLEAKVVSLEQKLEQEKAERQQTTHLLKQAEARCRTWEANLNYVLNHEVVAIGCLRYFDPDHCEVVFRSTGHEAIFGYTVSELMENPSLWESRIPLEDRETLFQQRNQAFFAGQPIKLRYRFYHQDGSLRWILGTFASQWDDVQNCWIVTFIETDITDCKQAEAALKESEERFRQLVEYIDEVFFIKSQDLQQTLYVSPSYEQLWGRTCESLYQEPQSWLTAIHPNDRESMMAKLAQMAQGERTQQECQIIRPDGSLRWIFCRTFPIFDETGKLTRHAGIAEDITERKQLELALQRSQTELKDVFDNVLASIMSFRIFADRTWVYDHCSAGCEDLYGYTAQDFLADPNLWLLLVLPEDMEAVLMPAFEDVFAERTITLEFRIIHKDGRLRWISETLTSRRDQTADCWIVTAVAIDVSDRKLTEIALHQSEARFRAIFEHAGIGIAFISPPNYKLEYTNPTFQRMLGYSNVELANLNYSHITHPEDLLTEQALVQQILAGNTEVYTLEKRYIRKDGQIVWVNLINSVIRTASGEVEFAIALVEDISNRKQAEQELQFQANLLNQVRNAIICVDLEGRVMYWNRFAEVLYQWTSDQVLGRNVAEFIFPPEQYEAMVAVFADLSQTRQAEGEYLMQRRDGSVLSAMAVISAIGDQQGQMTGFVGVLTDISDRKQAEELLKTSEKRLSLAVHAAKAGIWEWDLVANRIFWSEESFRLLGYETGSEGMLYEDWIKIVHPDDREQVDRYVKQLLESGTNFNTEYRVLLPDGSARWLSDIGEITHDEHGNQVSMIGIQMDISERKQTEAQIQASLREKEVLLKEIHHRVKNNLQIVSSLLNLQAELIEDPQIRKIFEDSWSRIDAMALVHESLYQSHNFSSINFSTYIHALASHLLQIYNVQPGRVTSQIEVDPQVSLSLNQAIPCGLILNELITNALKYGTQLGQNNQIIVRCLKTSDTQIVLTVENSGDALPPDFDLTSVQSTGIRLVLNLVEQLEGSLELERGRFTRFRICFNPLLDEESEDLEQVDG